MVFLCHTGMTSPMPASPMSCVSCRKEARLKKGTNQWCVHVAAAFRAPCAPRPHPVLTFNCRTNVEWPPATVRSTGATRAHSPRGSADVGHRHSRAPRACRCACFHSTTTSIAKCVVPHVSYAGCAGHRREARGGHASWLGDGQGFPRKWGRT